MSRVKKPRSSFSTQENKDVYVKPMVVSDSKVSDEGMYEHSKDHSDEVVSPKGSFSEEEIFKAFNVISNGKQTIMAQDLTDFLTDIHEPSFKKYEMIRLLDKENKGYVTKQQFCQFCSEQLIPEEVIKLPVRMQKRRNWIKCIEDNFEVFEKFENVEFCKYAAKQMRNCIDSDVLF